MRRAAFSFPPFPLYSAMGHKSAASHHECSRKTMITHDLKKIKERERETQLLEQKPNRNESLA